MIKKEVEMKIDINFTSYYGTRILHNNFLQKVSPDDDLFMDKFINRIKVCTTDEEASLISNILALKKPNFKKISPVCFKYKEYIIQNFHKLHGASYLRTLRLLQNSNISIAPRLIDAVCVDDSLFIISKINGAKSGTLMPFIRSQVSQEAKAEAFYDLKKLTSIGLVNQELIKSPANFLVIPETKKMIIPNWREVRRVNQNENSLLINTYFDILFRN